MRLAPPRLIDCPVCNGAGGWGDHRGPEHDRECYACDTTGQVLKPEGWHFKATFRGTLSAFRFYQDRETRELCWALTRRAS